VIAVERDYMQGKTRTGSDLRFGRGLFGNCAVLAPIAPEPDGPPSVGIRREVFGLAEGDVVISFPENLSSESYEDLEAYFELFPAQSEAPRRGRSGPSAARRG